MKYYYLFERNSARTTRTKRAVSRVFLSYNILPTHFFFNNYLFIFLWTLYEMSKRSDVPIHDREHELSVLKKVSHRRVF